LEGDFVECGVNFGFLSSSIMAYLDWNKMNRHFYLFDTFRGLDPKYVTDEEVTKGVLRLGYSECYERAVSNFSEFRNVHLIRGTVPETLGVVPIPSVCYLSLDMNCSLPEVAALDHFWDKLVPGAVVLLDDYARRGANHLKRALDACAASKGVEILSLPTGQGLILRHG
jgi:hypothetical protein